MAASKPRTTKKKVVKKKKATKKVTKKPTQKVSTTKSIKDRLTIDKLLEIERKETMVMRSPSNIRFQVTELTPKQQEREQQLKNFFTSFEKLVEKQSAIAILAARELAKKLSSVENVKFLFAYCWDTIWSDERDVANGGLIGLRHWRLSFQYPHGSFVKILTLAINLDIRKNAKTTYTVYIDDESSALTWTDRDKFIDLKDVTPDTVPIALQELISRPERRDAL